jgi:hypothetical protein
MATQYFAIEEKIRDILRADDRTRIITRNNREHCVTIETEEVFQYNTAKTPWVGIYLDSWETESEKISAGKRFTTTLVFEIAIVEFSMEDREAAILRDLLLSQVRAVLADPDNRKLRSKQDLGVLVTRIAGGRFGNPKTSPEGGFFKDVTLKLEVDIKEIQT